MGVSKQCGQAHNQRAQLRPTQRVRKYTKGTGLSAGDQNSTPEEVAQNLEAWEVRADWRVSDPRHIVGVIERLLKSGVPPPPPAAPSQSL